MLLVVIGALASASYGLADDFSLPPDQGPPRARTTEYGAQPGVPIRLAQQPEIVPPVRASQGNAQAPPFAGDAGSGPRGAAGAFGPDQVRLPLLDSESPRLGTTPHPSPEVVQRYKQFVDQIIDPSNTLDLVANRPRILMLKSAPTRVQIADEAIASYTIITPTELSVAGTGVGSTVLNLWFPDPNAPGKAKILSYLVRVTPDPEQKQRLERVYKALELEINKTFPDSVVHLALVGDKVAVSGQAKDIVDAAHILQVVGANAPGQRTGASGASRQQGANALVNTPFDVSTPFMSGRPQDFIAAERASAEDALTNQLSRYSTNVINLLHVPGEQQVMLRVTVAEVNRSAARSIGMDFSITNKNGITVFSQATNAVTSAAMAGTAVATSGANLPTLLDNGQVSLAINALRSLNLAKSLAEPNLVTLNGQPAQFSAGGEFPVPAASVAFGAVGQGVAFVPFGIQLRFVPYITDRDRIRLQVAASVSTRDDSLGTSVNGSAAAGGTSVPGLDSRTFQTTLELREGQTLAVAGLIQTNFGAMANRVPFFGDLPIVGNAFGRNSTSSAEQELVILITPELVHPLEACQTPGIPGDDIFEPGDVEFYLLGHLEGRRMDDYRSSVRTDWARMKRFEHCEDTFIIGARGHSYGCCGHDNQACGRPTTAPTPSIEALPAPPPDASSSSPGRRDTSTATAPSGAGAERR